MSATFKQSVFDAHDPIAQMNLFGVRVPTSPSPTSPAPAPTDAKNTIKARTTPVIATTVPNSKTILGPKHKPSLPPIPESSAEHKHTADAKHTKTSRKYITPVRSKQQSHPVAATSQMNIAKPLVAVRAQPLGVSSQPVDCPSTLVNFISAPSSPAALPDSTKPLKPARPAATNAETTVSCPKVCQTVDIPNKNSIANIFDRHQHHQREHKTTRLPMRSLLLTPSASLSELVCVLETQSTASDESFDASVDGDDYDSDDSDDLSVCSKQTLSPASPFGNNSTGDNFGSAFGPDGDCGNDMNTEPPHTACPNTRLVQRLLADVEQVVSRLAQSRDTHLRRQCAAQKLCSDTLDTTRSPQRIEEETSRTSAHFVKHVGQLVQGTMTKRADFGYDSVYDGDGDGDIDDIDGDLTGFGVLATWVHHYVHADQGRALHSIPQLLAQLVRFGPECRWHLDDVRLMLATQFWSFVSVMQHALLLVITHPTLNGQDCVHSPLSSSSSSSSSSSLSSSSDATSSNHPWQQLADGTDMDVDSTGDDDSTYDDGDNNNELLARALQILFDLSDLTYPLTSLLSLAFIRRLHNLATPDHDNVADDLVVDRMPAMCLLATSSQPHLTSLITTHDHEAIVTLSRNLGIEPPLVARLPFGLHSDTTPVKKASPLTAPTAAANNVPSSSSSLYTSTKNTSSGNDIRAQHRSDAHFGHSIAMLQTHLRFVVDLRPLVMVKPRLNVHVDTLATDTWFGTGMSDVHDHQSTDCSTDIFGLGIDTTATNDKTVDPNGPRANIETETTPQGYNLLLQRFGIVLTNDTEAGRVEPSLCRRLLHRTTNAIRQLWSTTLDINGTTNDVDIPHLKSADERHRHAYARPTSTLLPTVAPNVVANYAPHAYSSIRTNLGAHNIPQTRANHKREFIEARLRRPEFLFGGMGLAGVGLTRGDDTPVSPHLTTDFDILFQRLERHMSAQKHGQPCGVDDDGDNPTPLDFLHHYMEQTLSDKGPTGKNQQLTSTGRRFDPQIVPDMTLHALSLCPSVFIMSYTDQYNRDISTRFGQDGDYNDTAPDVYAAWAHKFVLEAGGMLPLQFV